MPETAPSPEKRRTAAPAARGQTATVGPGTFIKGRVEGKDDLLVQGRIEGTIKLPKNRVIVAPGGQVKANITASTIYIEGRANGKLKGSEEVTVRSGGQLEGEIVAPRVSLEPGAEFRGSIDMDDDTTAKSSKRAAGGS